MRIAFTATEAGGFDDDFALSCGVNGVDIEGKEHGFGFDRLSEQAAEDYPDEDWGVHTQFDDQINGAYGVLRAVRLTRTSLSVDLSKQLGKLEGVTGFDIDLAIDDKEFSEIELFMGRVFRGMQDVYGGVGGAE